MSPGITFTSPDGKTYTTGKRGRKPAWVYSDPNFIKLNQTTPTNQTTPSHSQLKCWRWADQLGDEGLKIKTTMCIVAAHDPREAINILSRRFIGNPVSAAEFKLMWKQIDNDGSIKTPGVYEHNTDKVLILKNS
jgi:hypothetical protein